MTNQQVTASLSIAALLYLGPVPDVTGSDFSYAEVELEALDFEGISRSLSEADFSGPFLFEPLADNVDDVSYESFARLAARRSRFGRIAEVPEAWRTMRPHFDAAYLRDLIQEEEGEG